MAGLTAAELEAVVGVDASPFSSGLDKMLGMLEGWGGKAGKVFAGVGAAGGALFAAGIASAFSLDDVRAQLQAELGLTVDDAARYGDIAAAAYANNFGESLEEVASATAAVVSSIKGMRKASDAEVQAMTERALTFAQVFEIDVNRAVQVAGQAVKQGLATDATQAFDLITATMQRVPKNIREDVIDAIDEYGGVMAQLGKTGEEAFTLLAKSSAKGMFGIDKTGDALKEFTLLATDLDAAGETYKQLGLNGRQMSDDLLAGGDRAAKAFDQIVDGLLGIENPTNRAKHAIALFGAPIEDLGKKDIPKFLAALDRGKEGLGDFEGSTDRMSKALGSTASANIASFWRGLQAATVTALGQYLIPYTRDATAWLTQNLGPALATIGGIATTVGGALLRFAGWVDANRTPIMVVAGVITGLLIPALIGWAVQQGITTAMAVMSWTLTQAAAVKSAAAQVVAAWRVVAGWVLMGAQALLGAARVAAAWFIALGPIGWAIAAIAGVVVLVIKYWDDIKRITAKVWSWVVDKVKWAAGLAVKVFRNFTLPGLIIKHWSKIKAVFSAGVAAVVGFAKSLPGRILSALSGLGKALTTPHRLALNAALSIVRGLGGKVVSWIAGIPGKLLSLGSKFASAGKSILQKFIDGMKNAAGIISGIAGNVWDTVRGLLNGAIGKINDALEFKIKVGPKSFSINPPDIPQLATGGRATSATLAVIGEGREPESVLPDSVLRGLLERAHAAGAAGADRGSRGDGRVMGDVHIHGTDRDRTSEFIGQLDHLMRAARYGGVYANAG